MSANIDFQHELHQYTVDGEKMPSVTQVLDLLQDFSGIDPAVLARKCKIGTAVHAACELHLLSRLIEETLHEDIVGYFAGFKKFLSDTGFKAEHLEQKVFSRSHGFNVVGCLDLIGKLNGLRVLIDIKTAAVISNVTGLQLSAYQHAYTESTNRKIDARFALQLKPNGKYKLVPFKSRSDLSVFLSALNIINWRNQHAK